MHFLELQYGPLTVMWREAVLVSNDLYPRPFIVTEKPARCHHSLHHPHGFPLSGLDVLLTHQRRHPAQHGSKSFQLSLRMVDALALQGWLDPERALEFMAMLQKKAYLLPEHLLSLVHFLGPLLVEDRDVICLVHFCEKGERAVLFLDRVLDIALVR